MTALTKKTYIVRISTMPLFIYNFKSFDFRNVIITATPKKKTTTKKAHLR